MPEYLSCSKINTGKISVIRENDKVYIELI